MSKRPLVVGHDTASATSPVGRNAPSHFVRGFLMYYTDEEIVAKRKELIELDKKEAREYILSRT